jgi:hypothetical protein
MTPPCCLRVYVYPPIITWLPEPLFMKLGMRIMASEPISTRIFPISNTNSTISQIISISALHYALLKFPPSPMLVVSDTHFRVKEK